MTCAAPIPFGAVEDDTADRSDAPGHALRAHLIAGAFALGALGVCAWLGVVKFDEGWYIVSSRLVAHGALPYRDFAFTQGPLLAYVLAPVQLIAPGIVTARITSTVCAALGIVLVLSTARRLAGRRAAWVTGVLLLCTFPALPYWLSQTKTYGVASLFLAATVAILTSEARPAIRLPLATTAAACFALTRLSGAALAVIVFVYCVYAAPDRRTRRRIYGVAGACAVPFLVIAGISGNRALWNLFSYHQMTAYWANAHVSTFLNRASELFEAWPFVSFLLLVAVGVLAITRDRAVRARVRAHPELVVVVIGLAAFVITHMLSGAFFAEEYVSPLIPVLVMLAVVMIMRLHIWFPNGEDAVLGLAIAIAILLTPHSGYLGAPGWKGSPQALAPLTRCIDDHSRGGDRVFALVALDAVTSAHRTPVPGLSLGVFSYEDVSTPRAEYLHIVNADLVDRAIASPRTSLVVLTNVDRQLLSFRGWFSLDHQDIAPIDRTLSESYRPVCTVDLVRELQNQPVRATVYARKP